MKGQPSAISRQPPAASRQQIEIAHSSWQEHKTGSSLLFAVSCELIAEG